MLTQISVALSLQQQLLEAGQVPVTDRDWKVDIIVTPEDIITREELVIV
jgi:5-formyltetrahydrofolate cyclo-ligase